MEREKITISNIQRFSLHDGPGIRTTVFLKGCSLRCPWCSNPENISPQIQKYVHNGVEGIYGRKITQNELIAECLKDREYYTGTLERSLWSITNADQIPLLPGGVTFSGGEPLLQISNLRSVCEQLHNQKIHIAAETSLFVGEESLFQALKLIDLFLIDVKIMDEEKCRSIEKGDIHQYRKNLGILFSWRDNRSRKKPVIIRVPVIGGKTDDTNNRRNIRTLLDKYADSILKIELIKEHNLGKNKYASLNLEDPYYGVDDDLMNQYREELFGLGIQVEVCRAF